MDNINNNSFNNNYDINNEILFWKIFKNIYINKLIFSKINYRECFTKTYEEIYKVGEMLKNNSNNSTSSSSSTFLELLLDKVLNEKYLVFENVSVIKSLLQKPFFKGNDQFFTKLRDYYKIDKLLLSSKENLAVGEFPIGTNELDIVYLCIICDNLSAFKVFFNSFTSTSSSTSSSIDNDNLKFYLRCAIEYQNLEILDIIYKNYISSNNSNSNGWKAIGEDDDIEIYSLFFERPNTDIIRYAIKEMKMKFNPSKISLLTIFKVDYELVLELMGQDARNKVKQIEQPISIFSLFYYDWFQGSLNDLLIHSKSLLLIENIYRITQNPIISSTKLKEFNNLINHFDNSDNNNNNNSKSNKLYSLSNDNEIFKLLKVYIEILLIKYLDKDYFFHNDGKKKYQLYNLIEYAVRFNNLEIIDLILNMSSSVYSSSSPPSLNSQQKKKQQPKNNNSIYTAIIEKSIEYCNQELFNKSINKLELRNHKFSFNIKSNNNNKIFSFILNNNNNNINNIKSFINNCIFKNIDKINISSFYTMLILLDNIEIIKYFYENKGSINNIHCSVLEHVQSTSTLNEILINQDQTFYSIWDIEKLITIRNRLDLLNEIENYCKSQHSTSSENIIVQNLKKLKNNQEFSSLVIKANNSNLGIIKYLVENGYDISYNTILAELANSIRTSENLYKNSFIKFKYILDLNDQYPNNQQFKYGNSFLSTMEFSSNLEIALFIKDYRPWDLFSSIDSLEKNDNQVELEAKFKYYNPNTMNIYEFGSYPNQRIIRVLLKTGRFNLLLDYLKYKRNLIHQSTIASSQQQQTVQAVNQAEEEIDNHTQLILFLNEIITLIDIDKAPFSIFKQYLIFEKENYIQPQTLTRTEENSNNIELSSEQQPISQFYKNYLENLLKESVKTSNLQIIKLLYKLYPSLFSNFNSSNQFFQKYRYFYLKNIQLENFINQIINNSKEK